MSVSDQSEDGQVISPGGMSGGEEETTDSLDIKPPQASSGSYYGKRKEKKSKHSRGEHHRHSGTSGDRDHHYSSGSSSRRGEYRSGHRERYQKGSGSGSSRSGRDGREKEGRYHSGSAPAGGHHSRFEMNPFYGELRETYQSKKERDYEKERERGGRNKEVEKPDAEKLLEDLRTRLLHKKSKHDSTRQQQDQGGVVELVEGRKEKRHHHHRHRDRKQTVEPETVEIMDDESEQQPLDVEEEDDQMKVVDREHDARRARLLEAERQMAHRKEVARNELETRRQMRKERKEASPDSPEVEDEEMESVEEKKKKKKRKKSKKRVESEEEASDDSDQTEEDTDSDSSSSSSDSDDSQEGSEDGKPPESPLSVGDLAKSERRRRSDSRSDSRSRSTRSRTYSHSSRSRSRSPHRRRQHGSSRSASPRSDQEGGRRSREREEPAKPPVAAAASESIAVEDVEELPPYFPGIQGCRSVEEFQCLNRIEEGTYGVVYRAKDKRTEEIVALKRLKMEKEKEGFPITSLREINTLLKGQHPNIVTVREIVVGSNMDKIFIVMDYVEHDLKSLMETMKHKKQVFLPGEVKCLTQQLLRAVAHLHDNWILHRDLKTSNLLLSHKGILKVGDFGLAREYGSPLKAYTSIVVTLWYRAPELLLCCKEYSTPIDIWSVGCIFAEFLSMGALFPGKTEIDQLNRIFKELGTPNEKIWPGYNQLPAVQKMTFTEYPVSNLRKRFAHQTSELGISLLQGLLTFDPKQRLTADAALKNNYFKELPLPIDPAMFPTWPAKSELGLKKALASSPKPPSGGGEFKKLGDDAVPDNPGFHLGGTYAESRQMAMGPGFSLKF
ncbi:cdk10/11 [Culex quinquefasciatus]|uniref:cyclin-dependent kinase n=1 Tax=Culex quinquefasciatus TaxID=7176 RepID=B0W814_CULQU|nr:cdk10/11 [Culex quinquefasciatus]|eukprot:XP_001844848.1 cdk10/11 [Culex quinquefasciatus]